MAFEPKFFDGLIGTTGFSEQLLKNHFTLYQGYVSNTNKLADALGVLAKDGKSGAEFAELRRRFGWEFNGMRLHEHYFGNIIKGGKPLDRESAGAMRGIGWVVLYYDAASGKLFNVWVNEYDAGHLSGAAPLLVMDVFEHAYMIDYQLKKADYIESFFRAIDWNAVAKRLEDAC